MNRFFLGLTLGNDPHTVGIYKAARIAGMAGIDSFVVPPATSNEDKILLVKKYNPYFLGLSYRLSPDKGIQELKKFISLLEDSKLIGGTENRKLCFAALPETLNAVHELGIEKKYSISMMGQFKNIEDTTKNTLNYFNVSLLESKRILDIIKKETEPEKIELLSQLAEEVVKDDGYMDELPLRIPSDAAKADLTKRISESDIPVIRTHFGIPSDKIDPTVEGIMKIASARAVDEISLGSSDLSQRYYGNPDAFDNIKNDGGVPYKNKEDLKKLFLASRTGNFPSVKPYCHVTNMKQFVDDCLDVGMLIGAHQAVPLFWFSELDGRGPLSVDKAIDEHIDLVKYLVSKKIPTEMNDPNQWSSRAVHDTVFVADYGLIASVMYNANSQNMIFQFQFNKPAETGDYGDLAKFKAARELISLLKPYRNNSNIFIESRSGIEHFNTNQSIAKFQLARSTMLQMILRPSIIHLVSYCEAIHAATPDDIIESSKIVRRAIRIFKKYEREIREKANHKFVAERKIFLLSESQYLLRKIARLSENQNITIDNLYKFLSDPDNLKNAMRMRYMTAPGIMNNEYKNNNILTRPSEFGVINCYLNWEDTELMTEKERLERNWEI